MTTTTVFCFFLLSSATISVFSITVPNGINKSPSVKSLKVKTSRPPYNQERYDNSVNDYLTERICGFNEMCKEEFSTKFRCRCPSWSYCSSPGRYYNAYCAMSGAGYLWSQPQEFFNDQPPKIQRYKKKMHKAKTLPHSLTSNSKGLI